MARDRELKVKILGDSSGAQKAFKEVDDAAGRSEGRLSKVSGAVKGMFGTAVVGAIGGIGKKLFDLGADFETLRAKAETVFGTTAIEEVRDWAEESANQMGLTAREAEALAAGLGDLLIPLGFARDRAADMSTKVLGLAGALSQWTGGQKDAAEVADILQDAILGERDSLKQLGIQIEAEEVKAAAALIKAKDASGEMTDAQAEALATVELLFAKSSDAQTAYNDDVKTTNERLAESKAKLKELRDEIATRVHPAVVAFLDDFLAGLEEISNWEEPDWLKEVDSWKESLGEWVRDKLPGQQSGEDEGPNRIDPPSEPRDVTPAPPPAPGVGEGPSVPTAPTLDNLPPLPGTGIHAASDTTRVESPTVINITNNITGESDPYATAEVTSHLTAQRVALVTRG